ncbi:MAG: uncharacterized protein JWQ97_3727 [Phenylobacterium sp.]|nr:uncharacterized protein [Phenylobacterium sp.]
MRFRDHLRRVLAWILGPQPAPAAAPPKRRLRISDEAVARSRAPAAQTFNPFAVDPAKLHPSASRPKIAMDESVSQANAWAASAITGVLAEGQAFLGYPVLAELAQRPEYRRISETIARHMTRKWIKLQATGEGDKSEKIAAIEDTMKRLGVKAAFQKAAEQDGFFGRGHIYLDLGTTDDPDELKTSIGNGADETSIAKIGKGALKRLRPVEAVWCYPTRYNSNDPLQPDWYRPTSWFVMGKELHASRLLTFVGREVPDLLKPAYSFGGLSLSQMVKPYVDNWIETRQSVNDIVSAFSIFVLKTSLVDALEVDPSGGQLLKRAELFNNLRDNRGLLIADKDTEDFENVSAPLGTLDQLQAQAQEHMAAVSGIPTVLLLMISPAGLNASSDGELQAFYDWVNAEQEARFRPNLNKVLDFIQMSEFGKIDPDITYEFEPLWGLNENEISEKQSRDAQTDAVLIESGVVGAEEARRRWANDPASPYPGLDAEDVPLQPPGETEGDPPAPETKAAA